jgi:hypothetical protein
MSDGVPSSPSGDFELLMVFALSKPHSDDRRIGVFLRGRH